MAEKNSLYEQLKAYGQSDYYPFHMPGHKRNGCVKEFPVDIDITEIDGFDNLHHAKGILKGAMSRAARIYGAKRSFFLINGSTAGLLSAISAVAQMRGGTVIMARNCHKAAYHAAYLNGLDVKYVYPQMYVEEGISLQGSIAPQDIELLLKENENVKAVILTSPTYDGIISDIKAIVELVHAYNVPLIVDEAHGAHFGFHESFPKSAVTLGADLVVQSLHKTLPSMTQTALLHVNGSLINERIVQKYTAIYQTSSPSYVMMAGMDSCISLLESDSWQFFEKHQKLLKSFIDEIQGKGSRKEKLAHLKVVVFWEETNQTFLFGKDPSKILIFTGRTGKSGKWLYDVLLKEYHLQMEMAAGNYVLAMTSIMDREEGFRRLADALFAIDKVLSENLKPCGVNVETLKIIKPKVSYSIAEAESCTGKMVPIIESKGCISKEYIYLYPPGCPILVPGEKIDDKIIEYINRYKKLEFSIEGLWDEEAKWIEVVS